MEKQRVVNKIVDITLLSIATVGGVGFIPFAPGTMGSIVATFFYYFSSFSNMSYFILVAILFGVGIYVSSRSEKLLNKTDASQIVIDEFVGILITFFFIPKTILFLVIGFVLFRFFDIKKPLGINKLQDYHGGLGIMLDDVLAGIYANITLHIGLLLYKLFFM